MALRIKGDSSDARGAGTYYFLDVGRRKYGDCILVVFDDVRILIDGSHKEDYDNPSDGQESIPDQLQAIFRHPPPFPITLLVVTHCHADHIGCLPDLVANDVIRPEWALVTHRKFGFGRSRSDDANADLADERSRRIAAALREEDMSDLSDAELGEFLDAVATVESRYNEFLSDLEARNVEVVEYHGQKLPDGLLKAVRKSGMKLLGPTRDQLTLCADQISTTNKDTVDNVRAALDSDASMDDIELYRTLTAHYDASDARGNPRGSGMNCQSITFAFGPEGARALLAGDMQFSEPGVNGIGDEMKSLRERVRRAGPYRLFKTTHHTSHNGMDTDLLDELGYPPLIVHTGGLNDTSHPHPSMLKLLKTYSRTNGLVFARTDRNGLIEADPEGDGTLAKKKGRFNDFTDNAGDVLQGELLPATPGTTHVVSASRGNGQVVIVNLPPGPVDMSVAGVAIRVLAADATPQVSGAKQGSRMSPVRPHVPEPVAAQDRPAERAAYAPRRAGAVASRVELAPGRELPPLLFVTNPDGLRANIGSVEADAVIKAIREKAHAVCEVEADLDQATRRVSRALKANEGKIDGVVIVGGYDIVPSVALDVLGASLRNRLGSLANAEHDRFYIWSDEVYGDLEDDKIAELPVSRIPDGRDAGLVVAALRAKDLRAAGRFGIRNLERPFADDVWRSVAGTQPVNVSEKFLHSQARGAEAAEVCQYFMLHGMESDSTHFKGETASGGYTIAYTVANVPKTFEGMVFSGCCWGALTVSQKASMAGHAPVAPRVPERSIALSFLKAGANAFIGSTGAHYSGPDADPDENFAARLHQAFWKALPETGFRPSLALHRARLDFAKYLAQRSSGWDAIDYARRLKNRAQFTCLGLGW